MSYTENQLVESDRQLAEFYDEQPIPLDQLAYTDAFDAMYVRLQKHGELRTKHGVWVSLQRLQYHCLLPRK